MSNVIDVSSALSSGAAARALGISKQHLFRLEEAGRLNATRTAIGRLFDPVEVEQLAAERDADRAAA